MQKINYINLASQWEDERKELLPIIDKVLSSGQYIGGKYVEEFEARSADLCQTKYSVALNSGTDALVYGLYAVGVRRGDEVITPPNSFIATTAAIIHIGAKPVFVDVLPDQNIDPSKIEAYITSKTKAIMPVHLTGRMAKMDEIKKIADHFKISIIEDSAQAIGSRYKGIPSGKWGKVGCFSTHPLKNLNACGDGGFLTTDDDEIAANIKLIRSHGLIDRNTVGRFGHVSRMDAVQAAILNFRIAKLADVIAKRQKNALLYRQILNPQKIFIPADQPFEFSTHHTFVIQVNQRDKLRTKLIERGIETSIHYPIPIHLQPASINLGYSEGDFPKAELQAKGILSLPIHQYLSDDEIHKISMLINMLSE